jgi:hypothetical protein
MNCRMEHDAAVSALTRSGSPVSQIVETAERELFRVREEENKIRSEVGGATATRGYSRDATRPQKGF